MMSFIQKVSTAIGLGYFILVLFCSSIASANSFQSLKEKILVSDYSEAQKILSDEKIKWDKKDKSLLSFARGYVAMKVEKWDEAIGHFKSNISDEHRLAAYSHFFLGQVYRHKSDFKKAQKHFSQAVKLRPPRSIIYKSKFELSEIEIRKKKYKSAYRHLRYLQRRWKRTPEYPELLWRLTSVELKRGRKWRACRTARVLFSRYPAHPLVFDWGIRLKDSKFEGSKLNCLASFKDKQNRIRRLQWAGESERARKEIDLLKKDSPERLQYQVDKLLVKFLINDGFVDEAVKLWLPYYSSKNRNTEYLMILGKATSRAGQFQSAVGTYYKAYKLRPRSRDGRKALFKAAFLSYQFQDYDGATRKFEEFITNYKRSGLSRDAYWHLSWLRYLKGDYEGAIAGLNDILKKKKSRYRKVRRRWAKFSVEKIKFWKAMSLLRLEKFEAAKKTFEELTRDNLYSYYSQAAYARLFSLPGEQRPQITMRNPTSFVKNPSITELQEETNKSQPEPTVENESEDQLSEDEKVSDKGEDTDVADGDENSTDESVEDEEIQVTSFEDPKLQNLFLRGSDLVRLGIFELARWEFYEIERRTRNKDYLKKLMASYEEIDSFHRSSHISVVHFGRTRARKGIQAETMDLWKFGYPEAFKDKVYRYSKKFGVPRSFIYGIMRAESHFRATISSPVGAQGLMQIMPNTGRQLSRLLGEADFHPKMLTQPEVNIKLGTRYLHRLLKKYDKLIPLAAASYNAGPHRVENWVASFGKLEMDEFIEHIPFIETRNYVKKVIRNFAIYETLYGQSSQVGQDMAWLSMPIQVQISGRPATRENWDALY